MKKDFSFKSSSVSVQVRRNTACLTLKIARSFSGRTIDFIDTALSVQKDKDSSEEIFAEITFFDCYIHWFWWKFDLTYKFSSDNKILYRFLDTNM